MQIYYFIVDLHHIVAIICCKNLFLAGICFFEGGEGIADIPVLGDLIQHFVEGYWAIVPEFGAFLFEGGVCWAFVEGSKGVNHRCRVVVDIHLCHPAYFAWDQNVKVFLVDSKVHCCVIFIDSTKVNFSNAFSVWDSIWSTSL